jgi:tRNA-specific 2-thiouridylase
VKFGLLWQRARELGAARLATGHYARIGADPETGAPRLRMAADGAKDQSYFLFALREAELSRTVFPVGELTKGAVRAEAEALGLAVATKPESMEVCFVPDGDAAGFVERRAAPGALRPGMIVDQEGVELAAHAGVHRFTVGQRRGLGLSGGPRRYVGGLDATTGTVRVVDRAALRAAGVVVRSPSWVHERPVAGDLLAVRIRHRQALVPGRVVDATADEVRVAFVEGGPAVTPGQAAVFYRDDLVLGGGWIAGALA